MSTNHTLSPEAQKRCEDTATANELVALIGRELIQNAAQLPSDHARDVFWTAIHKAAAMRMACKPSCQLPPPSSQSSARPSQSMSEEVKEALGIAEHILSYAPHLPEEAGDFGDGITETASGIAENIRKKGRVSEKQMNALRNMRNGLDRWLERVGDDSDDDYDDADYSPPPRRETRMPNYTDDDIPF